ncbi:hypothetical protein KY495_01855 [Massilia sp. PAMC28688]|uniref:hypothetical protein n=1 Tax=Massilia sp. PAMC28688 TaxID=2861283 RepID=UPI001C63A25A|nr:hypothetical protein [Massilia sp. PAMC28688]QYF94006.1 hypothetical protein KY495_01855 [Massilia sp. PAMC28688]
MTLPLHIDDEEQFQVSQTIREFRLRRREMGQFPLPNPSTVVAAELLARSLMDMNAPDLGAVGVAEVTANGLTTYIATSSGFGMLPDDVIRQWSAYLTATLENSYQKVSCMSLRSHAIFYAPAHMDTIRFITQAFPAFEGRHQPISQANVDAAALALRRLPQDTPFGTDLAGGPQLVGYGPAMTAIRMALACAIGVRINAAGAEDARRNVLAALDRLNDELEDAPYGDRYMLAQNLAALANSGGHPEQFRYRENPLQSISAVTKIQGVLTDAWRVADLNRFCAEPKLFTYLANKGQPGRLTGQVAIWWDRTRTNNYCPAPGTGVWADYMLPCTSCQNRSQQMLQGIPVGPERVEEMPAMVLANKPAARQRRNSIG